MVGHLRLPAELGAARGGTLLGRRSAADIRKARDHVILARMDLWSLSRIVRLLGRCLPKYLFGRHRFWLDYEGVKLLFSPRSINPFTFLEVFVQQQYVPHLSDTSLQPVKNVVDLGANIGLFTAFAIAKLAAHKVVAVEMDGDDAAAMEKVVAANRWDTRVTCLAKAFYFENTTVGEFASRLGSGHRLDASGKGIATVTLPEIVRLFGGEPIDLLKVDIEGSERFLMTEASREILSGFVRQAMVEAHAHMGCTAEAVVDYFRAAGFECSVWRYFNIGVEGPAAPVVEARNIVLSRGSIHR